MRINKYLSECGICSRREADKLVAGGVVTVNAAPAVLGTDVKASDKVFVDGKAVKPLTKKTYYCFNKPRGVVCTFEKREANNLADYLKLNKWITYAGRLDKDSEGLLILTNDGDFIDALMTGSNRHEKEYIVQTAQSFNAEKIKRLRAGVYLKELDRTTLPCDAWQSGKNEFHIVLTQGINHQIKRMCKSIGLFVTSIKRIRIENINLSDLPLGKYRDITDEELGILMERIAGTPKSNLRWKNEKRYRG